jgi:hypothetical protein
MSAIGVRSMLVDLIVKNRGKLSEADVKAVVDYAEKDKSFTAAEKKALLQPATYLKAEPKLVSAGIAATDVVLDAQATKLMTELATRYGIVLKLPAAPSGTPTPPPSTALAQAALDLKTNLAKGKDLGTYVDWSLTTCGADVKFSTDVQGKKYPALVIDKPQWKDPAPRDLVKDNLAALVQVSTLDELKKFVDGLLTKEQAYFDVSGVTTKSTNETYGIQNLRRKTFFGGLRATLDKTKLSSADRGAAPAVLIPLTEKLFLGRDYQMQTGSHTNYWPYSDNYLSFLLTLVKQLAKGSDEYLTVRNRISDILRHKTVFSGSAVVERDFERSVNCAVVYNPKYSLDVGHRVSLKKSSTAFAPEYERLSVKTSGLPTNLQQYAGAKMYRDTDTAGTLIFDWMGEDATPNRVGQKVPAELVPFIEAHDVDPTDLGLRKLVSGESARSNVSMDWDENGIINVATIMIAWWGHCHNESPLNTAGMDPRKSVELYRADRGVAPENARASYPESDAWNILGAFTSDHESGYGRATSGGRLQPTEVDDTKFVGERNNGGHWLELSFKSAAARAVRIDAEVTELWHKSDPTTRYPDPMARYRRDIENPDGTFGVNPDWVAANVPEEDIITVDAKGRKIAYTTKFLTLDSAGDPTEESMSVTLDPTIDAFVKLAEEIVDRRREGGGRVVEHWYNPKTSDYYSVTQDVAKANNFQRKKLAESAKMATEKLLSSQETTYDDVLAIHDFVTEDMGLPFVFDTSPGESVWNYPVNELRIDQLATIEKTEANEKFTYTTYRLKFDTMGGPGGDVRYIVKRDHNGVMVRGLALDPMPDFAFRNEHWVCAPVALDKTGNVAYNISALNAGYLTDKTRAKIVPGLWEKQAAILFAALSDKTAPAGAYVFETTEGHLVSFDSKAEFDLAIAANLNVRKLEPTRA